MAPTSKLIIVHHRDKRQLTRSKARPFQGTFRFLDLPPEIRNIIYDYAIDLKGVENYFERYWVRLRDRGRRAANKVYSEASYYLKTKSVTFHHGLLDLQTIEDVIGKKVLQNISSITVSTHGHSIMHKNLLKVSWTGYLDIFVQLSEILKNYHQLKEFSILFDDEDLKWHLEHCWDRPDGQCGFKDQMAKALGHLRILRDIRNVTITGIPAHCAQEMKALMERPPPSFLDDFPPEIRNMIYLLCVDSSEYSFPFGRTLTNRNFGAAATGIPTPTILLLNWQIREEAIAEVRRAARDNMMKWISPIG